VDSLYEGGKISIQVLHMFCVPFSALTKKDCQARKFNKEDAVDHGRWKKLIKIG